MWLAAKCLHQGALTHREKALDQFSDSIPPNWGSHIGTFGDASTYLPQRIGGHQRGQCILFLSSFPLLPPCRSDLSTPNQHCIAGAGLPESYDERGFVGPKKKILVLLAFNPLWMGRCIFSSPKVITPCHGSFWWSWLCYELDQLGSDEHSSALTYTY